MSVNRHDWTRLTRGKLRRREYGDAGGHRPIPFLNYFGLLVVLAVWLLVCPSASLQAQQLQAGAAVIDITPPLGFPLWGYAARHDAPSVGVLDPLKARALVLAVGQQRIALVSLDLGRAPTRQVTAAIRERVRQEANIEHVFLVASHTHHGPILELDHWPTPQQPYVRQLEQKLSAVILDAAQRLRPARVGVASQQSTLNRNRHARRPDAPVDRDLLVLRVEDLDGHPLAHAVNFAAHATLQDARLCKFSADFPGALAALVEGETGVPCLFLQGAAGDLSPNPGEHRRADQFGQLLGREVLALATTIRCAEQPVMVLRACEETFQFRSRIDLANPLVKTALGMAFFPALIDFYEREYREGVRPQLTVAVLGDRLGIVGVSGEFFCGHALHLKRRARLEHLLFLGYCNDYQQYFPTIEAVAEKGYGVDPPVAVAEIGAGERIMDRALIHLLSLRGQIREMPRK